MSESNITAISTDPFEQMKQVTRWTGQVFDAQIQTIKRVGLLIFNVPITLIINTTERNIRYELSKFSSCDMTDATAKLQQTLDFALGHGWKLEIVNAPKPKRSRKPSNKRRTRRAKKVQRRKVAAAKS